MFRVGPGLEPGGVRTPLALAMNPFINGLFSWVETSVARPLSDGSVVTTGGILLRTHPM